MCNSTAGIRDCRLVPTYLLNPTISIETGMARVDFDQHVGRPLNQVRHEPDQTRRKSFN
jgi:hypothetical protein